jgi:hypothetical protein
MLRTFVLKIKLKKINCSVVYQCALFQRALKNSGIESEVVQGYCLIEDSACRHYWVETDTEKYDVARAISGLYDPAVNSFEVQLCRTIDEGTKRFDTGEQAIIDSNEQEYKTFVEDQKLFWNNAPRDVRTCNIKF